MNDGAHITTIPIDLDSLPTNPFTFLTVQGPDGGPVAAPCAISGCQFDVSADGKLLEQLTTLKRDYVALEAAAVLGETKLEEMEAGLAALRMMRWQPIDTAPKDGTWILLRGESEYFGRPHRVHLGHWDAAYGPRFMWQASEACAFEDDGGPPTHWMQAPR